MIVSNKENELKNTCGYFYSAYLEKSILVNSGYNCSHLRQKENVVVDGQVIGCCYSWSCPLIETYGSKQGVINHWVHKTS